LQDTSDQGDDGTRSDSPFSTKTVGDDHIDDCTQDSAALEGRDDTTSDGAVGIVEVFNELREGDDSSNDTRVIAEQEASNSEEGTRQNDCRFAHDCFSGYVNEVVVNDFQDLGKDLQDLIYTCAPHKAGVVCSMGSPKWAGKTVEGRSNADLNHGGTKSQAQSRLDTITRFQTAVPEFK
jgi:hypothetical protein